MTRDLVGAGLAGNFGGRGAADAAWSWSAAPRDAALAITGLRCSLHASPEVIRTPASIRLPWAAMNRWTNKPSFAVAPEVGFAFHF